MANDPQVAVRFAVKDAEVVRQALQNLGKDGEAALKRMDAAAKPVPKSLSAVSDTVSEVKGRATGLAGSLGLAGTALLGLGPVGLAVGAALGVAYLAFEKASEAAHNLAQSSAELKSFAAVTGLTINQASAVSKLGVEFGVSEEQVRGFVEKFTIGMDEVRRAEGPLFEAINRISPALAIQLAGAKDSADALNILAKAYHQAGEEGDKFRQARIARAAGGRGATETAQILDTINERGGVQQVTKDADAAGRAIDDVLVKHITKLRAEIEETRKNAERIGASIFSEGVLQKELLYAQYLERAAVAAKQIAESQSGMTWWQRYVEGVTRGITTTEGGQSAEDIAADQAEIDRRAARARIAKQLKDGKTTDLSGVYGALFPETASAGGSASANPQPKLSAEAQYNLYQKQFGALGGAATPAEQLKDEILKLAAAQEKSGVTATTAGRALEFFKQKQEETAVTTREQLGLAGEEEIRKVALTRIDRDYSNGYIKNAAERALADKVATKDAKERAEAVAVKASDFPGLTKLAQDGANFQKELDTGLSSSLRGLTSDIIAMAKGTETAGQAFTNMASKIAEAILQAVLLKTVIGPLAGGLSGGLSSLFGGNPAVAGAPGVVGSAGSLSVPTFSALGNIFPDGLSGFRNSVVDRPTMFRFASGGIGLMGEQPGSPGEAIIPLRRDARGSLGINASGVGGGINGTHTVNHYAGVEVTNTSQRRGMDVDIMTVVRPLAAAMADQTARGRGPMASLMPRPPLRG